MWLFDSPDFISQTVAIEFCFPGGTGGFPFLDESVPSADVPAAHDPFVHNPFEGAIAGERGPATAFLDSRADLYISPGQGAGGTAHLNWLATMLADESDDFVAPASKQMTIVAIEEASGPDIVVIGFRHDVSYGGGQLDPTDPAASIDDPNQEDGTQEEPSDCEETTATVGPLISLDEAEQDKLDTIGEAVNDLLDQIGARPAGTSFGSLSGSATAEELFDLLVQADWRITNQNYQNGTIEFGSVGAAYRNDGDPIFNLSEAGLAGWGQSPGYASFYVLHELAHVTLAGYSLSQAATAAGTQQAKNAVEQWANSMALLLYTTLFGTAPPFLNPPEPGYSTESFQQTSAENPSGETAGEAFDGCGGA